jgi:hypothetical protein
VRFHVLKRKLENLWRRKAVRAVAVAVVVLVTTLAQYVLANRPQQIDLSSSKVTIPAIFSGQILHVEALSDGLQITHTGKLSEEVDLHFTNARLGPTTILDYENKHPPTIASEIHCSPVVWQDETATSSHKSESRIKPCSTSIAIAPTTNRPGVVALNFFQTDTNGQGNYRHLVVEAADAEAEVKLKFLPPLPLPSSNSNPNINDTEEVDCGRVLSVGSWHERIGGAEEIETVMQPGSALRTRFSALAAGLWSGVDGYFEPYTLRSRQAGRTTSVPINAREVLIQSADGKQTVFSATSSNNSQIRIDNLKVGSDRLQIALSGTAYVTSNGEPVSESIMKQVEKYPLPSAALGALNLAILAWCIKTVKGLFA